MTQEAKKLIEELPGILRKYPELKYEVFRILNEEFVSRREMMEILEEMRQFRLETSERFKATQKQMDERFQAMQNQMDERFEATQKQMDERFEATQKQMDERFNAVQNQMKDQFNQLVSMNQDTKDWVGVVVGGFQVRAGRNLEEAVAATLRVALRMQGIEPEHIQMRQKIFDESGLIGPSGRSYEYDILIYNGESYVFEVKSVPDFEDVDRFRDKCDLVSRELDLKRVHCVIITLAKTPELIRYCEQKGVELP